MKPTPPLLRRSGWMMILVIFTHLSLIGMENSEDSTSSPPLPYETESSSSLTEEEITDIDELTKQAISLFFDDEVVSPHKHGFSFELSRRIHPQVVERNGNLRRLMHLRTQELNSSEERPQTPDETLRKELRDIVMPTLTELFDEREKEYYLNRKKLTTERLKYRLALITAGTTIFTTTAATITALVIALNQ